MTIMIADVIFIIVLIIKKVSIKDVFVYVFFAFSNLYGLSVYFVNKLKMYTTYTKDLQQLLSDEKIIIISNRTVAISIITFAVCILLFKRKNESHIYEVGSISFYKIGFWLLYPIALYLNSIVNWTYTRQKTILTSVTAYTRNFLTVFLIMIFSHPKNKTNIKLVYLLFYALITVKSTQRTNMFIVLIAFIYTEKNKLRYIVLGIVGILVIGSARNGVRITNFLYPILGEGIFGSWGMLQAIKAIESEGYSYQYFFQIFNETINWIFECIKVGVRLEVLGNVVAKNGMRYYPMGGFYFVSDAYLMHPVWGTIIYSVIIFLIYYYLQQIYSKTHSPTALLCLSLLFISIKGSFKTFAAMLLFHVIFYKICRYSTKLLSSNSTKLIWHK